MCAKKKAILNRTWKLAGEPLCSAPLSAGEKERISREFSEYDGYIRHTLASGGGCVTRSEAKVNESAAMVVSAYLCEHFAGRYEREAVVTAVATTVAIPANLSARLGRLPAFLMGAALWLLDYLEETCDDAEDYLSLLPLEPDVILEYAMPFADDLGHSRELILRMLTVLDGREGAYRKEFRTILSLIEADTAAWLRGLFRDALTDYMDRALRVCQLLGIAPWNPPQPLGLLGPSSLLDEFQIPQDDEHPSFRFLLMAPELICRPVSAVREELHSRKAAELISSYSTSDPYALCTAYILLEREKDALAGLNGLTAVVMICAMRHLPWAQDDLGARTSLIEQGAPDYKLQYVYGEQPGEEERLEPEWLLSEAQLFYIATGVVPPRNQRPSSELIHWFMEQGIAEHRAHELAWAAMYALHAEPPSNDWEDGSWDSEEGEAEEEEALPQNGTEEADADSGPLVELPWQVRRRVVVFGGHDSWRKAVKPLLPGARFYDREVLPDLNAIRGADVVWLQVNALSHKYYYRIIDAARKNGIPVRYFGSASAKKCAVQLALDELAAEKKAEV